MAETAIAERPNKVKVSDAGPNLKKLSIEVPAETVSAKLKESIDMLAGQAALPGFRPGKAPRQLVEKRFGEGVRAEAKNQLVAAAYQKAIEEHKLKVVGDPTSPELDKVELKEGKALAFEIEVEVMPEFTAPAIDGIAVKKPKVDVTPQMIDEEVTKLCINEGTLESREKAEPGDYITGHAVMTGKDGTEYYNLNGAVVQSPWPDKNGKGMILGVVVDDFAKQLGSPKAGDTFTIKTKGPENHEVEGIRNNDLTITFKVDRVDRIIPAKLEDIVAMSGLQSADQVREAIGNRLRQRMMVQQQVVMRQQIAKHLIESTKLDLPARLSATQSTRLLERRRLELMYRGVEAQKIEERIAELRAATAAEATRDLKLFFIMNRIADDLNVRVEEQEINGRIAQMAQERNVRFDKLRAELIQRNQIGGIFQQIREHKTMDAILAKAQVTEMSPEEFNKAMQAQN
ncbi:MAG: trigger factor [Phycisphaerales bacterium]|nr:trigger factor [Phycisphaerales bacterium]